MKAFSSLLKSPPTVVCKSSQLYHQKSFQPSLRFIILQQRNYKTEIKTFHLAGTYTTPEYSNEDRHQIREYLSHSFHSLEIIQESLNALQNNELLPEEGKQEEITKVQDFSNQMILTNKTIVPYIADPFRTSRFANRVSMTLKSLMVWPFVGVASHALWSNYGIALSMTGFLFLFWQDAKFVNPVIRRLNENTLESVQKSEGLVTHCFEMNRLFIQLRDSFAANNNNNGGPNNNQNNVTTTMVDLKTVMEELFHHHNQLEEEYSELLKIMRKPEKENEEQRGFLQR
jgi:hypothetical protein